jgi:hypothetical protein
MSSALGRGTDHRGGQGDASEKAEREDQGGINHSRSPFSVRVPLAVRRRPSFLPHIIALRAVFSPMGNGRARLTICNGEMAWWCKRASALV